MKTTTLLILAALAIVSMPAAAELCTIDTVPAATLLLPYFEVDLDDPNGTNTFFSINNAMAAPTVAHVTLWGDWAYPTLTFDVFLTGYDVETVSLRDVFVNGNLPVTAHAAADPTDVVSPHGGTFSDNPAWDSFPDELTAPTFSGCDGALPWMNPVLNASFLERIRLGHTGQPVPSAAGECFGADHGDNIARGYITIDNALDCSTLFPSDATYFGPGGVASDVNQLWGDWFIVNGEGGFAQGDNLVHIEAAPAPSVAFAANDYTFYGRYVAGLATDQREPLASTWGARYFNTLGNPGAYFDGGTDLLVWRDSKCGDPDPSATCGTGPMDGPPWYALGQTQVVSFDMAEQASEICTASDNCFPLATQRAAIGAAPLDPPFLFGWMYLNLNHTLGDTSSEDGPCTTTGLFGDIAQSWVSTNMTAFGSRLTVGFAAQQLTSACSIANPLITGDL